MCGLHSVPASSTAISSARSVCLSAISMTSTVDHVSIRFCFWRITSVLWKQSASVDSCYGLFSILWSELFWSLVTKITCIQLSSESKEWFLRHVGSFGLAATTMWGFFVVIDWCQQLLLVFIVLWDLRWWVLMMGASSFPICAALLYCQSRVPSIVAIVYPLTGNTSRHRSSKPPSDFAAS